MVLDMRDCSAGVWTALCQNRNAVEKLAVLYKAAGCIFTEVF